MYVISQVKPWPPSNLLDAPIKRCISAYQISVDSTLKNDITDEDVTGAKWVEMKSFKPEQLSPFAEIAHAILMQ